MTKIYDISPIISENTAIFPGDTAYSRCINMKFPDNHMELSHITTTLHIGAHTDAPSHYHENGKDIADRDLDYYLGECQVIEVQLNKNCAIFPQDIKEKIQAKRVLFKTGSFPDPNHFNTDFNSLSPELILTLKAVGVVLVGIDTPSVDPADSKELPAHKAIYESNMAILEGIILKDVPTSIYELIALPLKLKGADASPVRAVLREY